MTVATECGAARHGTRGAYQAAGCRCPEAITAKRLYDKRMRVGTQRGGYVPALGAQRRIQALAVLGWTNKDIADRSGVSLRTVESITWGFTKSGRVMIGIHDKLAAAYRAMENEAGPSTLRATRAKGSGWAPPAAWDDIDDPNETPEEWVRKPAAGRHTLDLDEAAHLLRSGESAERAAARLGVHVDTIEKAAYTKKRDDIIRMLKEVGR